MSDRREKRPWYPRYAQDFIMGTMGMPLETRGAYSILLDLIYDRGGPIPDDPQWLAGLWGVSKRKWSTIRESLISEYRKITVKDGFISNARADAELIKSEKISRKQSENGVKGARARAENQARSNENNNLDQATLKPPQPQPHNKKKESIGDTSSMSSARPPLTKPPPERAPLTIDEIRHQTVLKVQGLRFAPRASVAGMVRDFVDHGADPSALMRVAGECSISNLSIDDFKTKAAQLLPGEIRTAITSNEEASHAQRASHSGRQSVTSAAEAAKRSFGGT